MSRTEQAVQPLGAPADRGGRARPLEQVRLTAVSAEAVTQRFDEVVGEEPLEMRLAGPGSEPVPVGVTMRTPGNDFELAVGFMLSEGLISGHRDVLSVRYCDADGGDQRYNVVTVDLRHAPSGEIRERVSTVTASCGVCGTATLDLLDRRCPVVGPGPAVPAEVLIGLPEELRRRQRWFDHTGGLHGAGLFEIPGGRFLAVREDVGRHNAVDKLTGWALLERRLPLSAVALVVSGRVSFEIVQKAALAGIPVLAAVSAPSSLAVATARRFGITLAGFVRGGRANVYSGVDRVEGTTR